MNKTTPPLPIEEERQLLKRFQETNDERAIEQVIAANTPLVIKIAHEMCSKNHDDYIAAGRIGLFKAAKRFDLSLDIRFVNYAHHWIRKEIRDQLHDQRIKIPAIIQHDFARAHNTMGRCGDPTPPDDYTDEYKRAWTIHAMRHATLHIGDKTDATPEYDIPDEQPNALDKLCELNREDVLQHLADNLDPRTADCIARYFNIIPNDEKCTMQTLGDEHGVSREAIRQTIKKGLTKLKFSMRHNNRINEHI